MPDPTGQGQETRAQETVTLWQGPSGRWHSDLNARARLIERGHLSERSEVRDFIPASSLERFAERVAELEEALSNAADDLGKASNQFKGLVPDGENWVRFAEKEARARAALIRDHTSEREED